MTATDTQDLHTEGSHGHHPTARDYVRIAIILAILTGLEVSSYFVDFGRVAIPLLLVLMAIKFVMVAGFFMHLKFDTRLFSKLMYGGLALAMTLYAITLVIFVFEGAPPS